MSRRRNSWVPPTPVTTKDQTVKAILRAIGSKAVKAYIVPAREVRYAGTYWDGGSRAEYTAVSLDTFRSVHGPKFDPPQFGGPKTDPVVDVPRGIVIVEHGVSCGKPARPRINVNPDDLVKLLPAGGGGSELPRGNPMSKTKPQRPYQTVCAAPICTKAATRIIEGRPFCAACGRQYSRPFSAKGRGRQGTRLDEWDADRPPTAFTRGNPRSSRGFECGCHQYHTCYLKRGEPLRRGEKKCQEGCGQWHNCHLLKRQRLRPSFTATRPRHNPDHGAADAWGKILHGSQSQTFSSLAVGDEFYFAHEGGKSGVNLFVKVSKNGWYTRSIGGRRWRTGGGSAVVKNVRTRHNPGLSNWAGGPEHTWVYPDGTKVSRGDTVRYRQYAGRGRSGPEYRPATGRVYLIGPAGAVVGNNSRSGGTGTVVTDETFIALVRKAK